MNKLYALIISGREAVVSGSYYAKKHFPAIHTPKSRALRDALIKDIPEDRLAVFACYICTAVLTTVFGNEIRQLDTENTYAEFSKDPNAPADASPLLWDVTCPATDMKYLYKWLSQDIKDRLLLPGWLDIVAAVCLQLLREVA